MSYGTERDLEDKCDFLREELDEALGHLGNFLRSGHRGPPLEEYQAAREFARGYDIEVE